MILNQYNNQTAQTTAILNQIKTTCDLLLQKQDHITIAVSGGRSPIPFFKVLSMLDIPWQKITITLVDERVVDTTCEDSNENLVKTYLLKNKALNTKFIGLVNMSYTEQEMLEYVNRHVPTIDIIILGMGEDGHTASIFPDMDEFQKAISLQNPDKYIITHPKSAKYTRISLTLREIIATQLIILSISGDKKYQVYQKAITNTTPSFPISYLFHHKKDVMMYYCNI